jgi:hypothetical protein
MNWVTDFRRADLVMLAWGGLIALSMMRVGSALFFTPIYLFALLALLSRDTRCALLALARRLPVVLVYFACATLSLLWASYPAMVGQALRADILIPCLALIASFYVLTRHATSGRIQFLLLGIWLGFLAGTAVSYLRFGPEWIDKTFDSVGYYSSYIFMLAGISLPFLQKSWRPVFYLLVAGLLFLTQQRVAWILFPVIGVADLFLHGRQHLTRSKLLLALIVLMGFSYGMLKMVQAGKAADSFNPEVKANSVIEHLAKNERIGAWQNWIARGMEAPLIGVGFGRDNVKQHYSKGLEWPEANLHHGHNVLLNNFLQLGLVGMLIFMAANLQFLHFLIQRRNDFARAGALIVIFFLLRNMFDDFSFKRLLVVYGLLLGSCLALALAIPKARTS